MKTKIKILGLVTAMLATPIVMYRVAAMLTPASVHDIFGGFAAVIMVTASVFIIRLFKLFYYNENLGEYQDLSEFYGPVDPTKETEELMRELMIPFIVIYSMLLVGFTSYIVYEGGSLHGAIIAVTAFFIASPLLLLLLAEALAKALEEIRSASSG